MDNDEENTADMAFHHLDTNNDNLLKEDITTHQIEKTPIQKIFMYSYSIFIVILLLGILYLLYRYFTKTSIESYPRTLQPLCSPKYYSENDRVYISNMLDNFIKNSS